MRSLVITITLLILLSGCKSTAKSDDYVQFTQLSGNAYELDSLPVFLLKNSEKIDIRGEYNVSNAVDSAGILYQGGAGIAGLLAQIATHAVINDNVRDGQLSAAQSDANKVLQPISHLIADMDTAHITVEDAEEYSLAIPSVTSGEHIKSRPIFFVAANFSSISLKNIVWIDGVSASKRKSKNKYKYSNLIQVSSRKFTNEEKKALLEPENADFLKKELQNLFHESLTIASREVKGNYRNSKNKMETFRLLGSSSKRYFRAEKVDTINDKLIVRNLRSWLVAMPLASIAP
jgi:hypothetical protein